MDLESLLNTKVITAAKFAEQISDAGGVISVVSRDELRRFGGITLSEILERVAGLTRSSAFIDRSLVAVRGDQTRANEGHVLILINGRPAREVMEGGLSSDILESFPVGVLEKIEVIKGPGSVLYGSNAFSGVINLITQKADATGYHVSAARGPSGEAAAAAEILVNRGGLGVVAAGQYRQMPQWNTHYLYGPPSAVSLHNVSLRNAGTGGYLGIDYKGLTFMSSYTALEAATFVRGYVGDMRVRRGFADLGYSLRATAKWEMSFNLTYTRSTLDTPDYPFAHRDSNEVVLEWTNFVTFSPKDRLTLGALYSREEGVETFAGVSPSLVVADGIRGAEGFYVQHEHKLTGDLKLIGGVQANKIGNIALNVVPRAGVVWNPAAHFTIKLLYGSAFRAPSLDETLLNHPGLKGNPNLVPERVGTLDIQFGYHSNRTQASIDFFDSRQADSIVQNGSTLPARYYNLGTAATFQGVDAEGKYYLRRNWFLMASVLYQVNLDEAGRSGLTPIPNLGVKAGVSYLAQNGTSVSLFDAYQGHLSGYASAVNPKPGAFHSINARVRFDLSKRWLKDPAPGVALFMNANDLTNRQLWLPAWGSGTPQTIPVLQGRTVYFGIEVWQKP